MTLNSVEDQRTAVPACTHQRSEQLVPEDFNAEDASTGEISNSEISTYEVAFVDALAGDALVGDADDDPVGLALIASVELSVVFSSLAAQCVPELCDNCTIDIVDGAQARYRIAYPPPHATGGGLRRIAERAGAADDHRIRVRFTNPASARASTECHDDHREAAHGESCGEFHGVATFVWHRRTPSRADRATAAVLVDHAVHIVAWQRSEDRARAALTKVGHLQVALESSRQIGAAIGILMSQHKITRDQAFDLLRTGSQHSHRKLRDLALEVIDTGWLDPALLPDPPRPSPLNGGRRGSETSGTWHG